MRESIRNGVAQLDLSVLRTALTFQRKTDAVLAQANPVQNTWYTVLNTTLNAQIYYMIAIVATTGETLEARVTVDGLTYTGTQVATAGTYYFFYIDVVGSIVWQPALSQYPASGLVGAIEGRNIKIEIRKTTAAGTGTITATVMYGQRS